ncbi:hypothetical protein HDZ31DRAFT_66970 [Schizophyllum fasciatum]
MAPGAEVEGAMQKRSTKKEMEVQLDRDAVEWLRVNEGPEVADAPSAEDMRYAREKVQALQLQEILQRRMEAKAAASAAEAALAADDAAAYEEAFKLDVEGEAGNIELPDIPDYQSSVPEMWPDNDDLSDELPDPFPCFEVEREMPWTMEEIAVEKQKAPSVDPARRLRRIRFEFATGQYYGAYLERQDWHRYQAQEMRENGHLFTKEHIASLRKSSRRQMPLLKENLLKRAFAFQVQMKELEKAAAADNDWPEDEDEDVYEY